MNKEKQRLIQIASLADLWYELKEEAIAVSSAELVLSQMLMDKIISQEDFKAALAHNLADYLGDSSLNSSELRGIFLSLYDLQPMLLEQAFDDMKATLSRDPACNLYLEPFLFFKGFKALQAYRLAHVLWVDGRTFLAQVLQSSISRVFGVDIHPAAQMGSGILIDHATGLVVGETAVVGNNVSILHGVTLGGTGKESGDRHPKVEDGVLLSAHAQLLGNIRIGQGSKVGAGAVVLRDVQSHTTVAGVPAVRVGIPDCECPAFEMKVDFDSDLQKNA